MDEITRAVRAMYDQFPYPSGPVVNRVGSDAELVLSYGALASGHGGGGHGAKRGPLQVLDAGCGRARGLLGAATLQPQVQWLGIDISGAALADARREADQRGLKNVAFAEVDLMTLDGLEAPAGGFDVIHSSGVLHHLADPAAGLARLREVLAPHGVLNLMVYGRHGREPLQRLSAAIAGLVPPGTPLPGRLPLARQAAAVARDHVLAGSRFADTADVDDVELVDRLLNVNETSYDVPTLLALLESAGLHLLRWAEPAEWDPGRQLPEGPLRQRVLQLPPPQRWAFLEVLLRPAGLELIAAHADNPPRPALTADAVAGARLRFNPEVVVTTEVRHTPGEVRTEGLSFTLRKREPVRLTAGPVAAAVLHLSRQPGARPGKQVLRDLQGLGLGREDAVAMVLELARHELLFVVP